MKNQSESVVAKWGRRMGLGLIGLIVAVVGLWAVHVFFEQFGSAGLFGDRPAGWGGISAIRAVCHRIDSDHPRWGFGLTQRFSATGGLYFWGQHRE